MRNAVTPGSLGLSAIAFLLVATVLFGSPFKPLLLASYGTPRLGAPYWPAIALGGLALAAAAFARWSQWKLPLFAALALAIPTLLVGLYADHLRAQAFAEFEADQELQHSFFRSIREAPKEFQLYFHGAAMKDCMPYGWSYRDMGFYPLPPQVAANVLPRDWLEECGSGFPPARE
ncbi:hypothetical protein [Alteraurantiacibacter aquimixticola]|uniref:Uncharacterized protein n=1 Tax=Alteraurantiacibacter aquimixticola TaxID=2489173 RepID=A0A4T3F0N6_9SPHN|nr:hypothetical protein [Alteraurantiacibacter aquimixticola]TIX48912.1 hypothetical protein E5222_14325 [Alteraurantiacibacter aquimixticola]